MKKDLVQQLAKLGFPLMELEEDFSAEKLLANVLKAKEKRLWEGFPVLLANAVEQYHITPERMRNSLDDKTREDFHQLVLLSLAVYKLYKLNYTWTRSLWKNLSKSDAQKADDLCSRLAHGEDFSLLGEQFNAQRVVNVFENYFQQEAVKAREQRQKLEEFSLEHALSQVFSPRQKELFKKKLKGEPFTKTEREYYSRAVKKKVLALANPELHRLARQLLGK